MCLAVGYVFGLPALRLEALYLALATFALAVATPQLLKYRWLEPWTGGVQGITLAKPDPPPASAARQRPVALFLLYLIVAVARST